MQTLITPKMAKTDFEKVGHGFLAYYITEIGISEGILSSDDGPVPVFERHFEIHRKQQAKKGYKCRIVQDDSQTADTKEYMPPSEIRVFYYKEEVDYKEAMQELWGYLCNLVNNDTVRVYQSGEIPTYLGNFPDYLRELLTEEEEKNNNRRKSMRAKQRRKHKE